MNFARLQLARARFASGRQPARSEPQASGVPYSTWSRYSERP